MTIKYAEITIIRNIEDEDIFSTLSRYFGYENTTDNKDMIIIIFDNGSIYDTKDEYIDKKYNFGQLGFIHKFPIYFDTDKGIHLFYKKPIEKNKIETLNFNSIFKNYYKHKTQQYESSIFNLIYEDIDEKELFAMCRIKSTEEKPRFLLAYDNTIFDKSDIIYFVDYLFKNKTS
jgi:hypothetical protein